MTNALKFVGRDEVAGLAIPYVAAMPSGFDLTGERFDASTDLCIDWFGKSGRPVLYDHGLDGSMKADRVGFQSDSEARAEGVWASSQLDLNRRYRKAIDRLIDEEALGYSAGAMPHLATKNARTGIITRFPWVELSLTPIPAEPSTLGVHYTKSIGDGLALLEGVDIEVPDAIKAALALVDTWAEAKDAAVPAKSYADEYERLVTDLTSFVELSADRVGIRAKSGRVLSSANRERLVELRSRIAAASEHASTVLADLDDLLVTSDPEATKALWSAVFEALTAEAAGLGVDVPTN